MKQKNGFGDMLVGLFVAGVLVLLAFFTIIISGSDLLRGKGQRLQVRFSNVGGLRPHDHVIVHGVPVGQVQKMWLDPASSVQVALLLETRVQMREGYRITVVNSTMLGGNHLMIEPGAGAALPDTTTFVGEQPRDLMRDVAEVVAGLRRTLEDEGTLANLRKASVSLVEVLGRVERGEGTLGKLFSKDDTIYTNIHAMVVNLRTVSDRLEKGEGVLGKLLSKDDTLYRDVSAVASNLCAVSSRLEQGEGTMGKLFSKDDTVYKDLSAVASNLCAVSARLEKGEGTLGKLLSKDDQLYRDAAQTIANLRAVSERLEKGEGTLGKLLSQDDTLYKDIKGLVGDARQALDGIRETTPVTTFSTILMGGL
jgi:phospholipid/cholesterol/gamma-HCH transport system substrate-binding protein